MNINAVKFEKYYNRYYSGKTISANEVIRRYRKLGHHIRRKTALDIIKSSKYSVYYFDLTTVPRENVYPELMKEIDDIQHHKSSLQKMKTHNNEYYLVGISIYGEEDEPHNHFIGFQNWSDFKFQYTDMINNMQANRDDVNTLEFIVWSKNKDKIIKLNDMEGFNNDKNEYW
jgi:hypothetical protein